jgi:hypothetical protein
LAATDDNTGLDATTSKHGLLKKLGGGTTDYLRADGTWATPPGGSGEANTASNVGTTGVGIFKQKSGVDLQLKKINAGSAKVTVTDDTGNDEVDVNVVTGTDANSVCVGNDSRLSDARTPTSHATSHRSGGGDAIKLDDLSAPDDNTDLDASTSKHGLLKKLGGGTTNFLRADGSWAAPTASSVFGSNYHYAEKTTSQSTTSTSFQQYTSLTTGTLPAGTYRIGWMVVGMNTGDSDHIKTRVQVDNTTNLIDPGGGGFCDNEYWSTTVRDVFCGFRRLTLSAAAHTIDIDFSTRSGGTAVLYHGQIELWRIS